MKESLREGLAPGLRSVSGRVGGDAAKLPAAADTALYGLSAKAIAYALAIAENNACMGKIVAAPPAGSCGILPGVLIAAQEHFALPDAVVAEAMFTAAAIGRVIAMQASVSGAEGRCPGQNGHGCSHGCSRVRAPDARRRRTGGQRLRLCADEHDGPGMRPRRRACRNACVYRNASGAAQALCSAQLALGGVVCPIACDELIAAMKDVGNALPPSLRETGEGGCAACACRSVE